jgi:hypothetical protein
VHEEGAELLAEPQRAAVVHGFHAVALGAAALYVAVVAWAAIPSPARGVNLPA